MGENLLCNAEGFELILKTGAMALRRYEELVKTTVLLPALEQDVERSLPGTHLWTTGMR
jgi:hypothetical protein